MSESDPSRARPRPPVSRLLSGIDRQASRPRSALIVLAGAAKLDEILQAMPGPDNSLLTLEHASDDELRATGDLHRGIRLAALGEQQGSPGAGRLTAAGNAQDN